MLSFSIEIIHFIMEGRPVSLFGSLYGSFLKYLGRCTFYGIGAYSGRGQYIYRGLAQPNGVKSQIWLWPCISEFICLLPQKQVLRHLSSSLAWANGGQFFIVGYVVPPVSKIF